MSYIILSAIILYLLYEEFQAGRKLFWSQYVWGGLIAVLARKADQSGDHREEVIREALERLFLFTYRNERFQTHNARWKAICDQYGVDIYRDDNGIISDQILGELARKIMVDPLLGDVLAGEVPAEAAMALPEKLQEIASQERRRSIKPVILLAAILLIVGVILWSNVVLPWLSGSIS